MLQNQAWLTAASWCLPVCRWHLIVHSANSLLIAIMYDRRGTEERLDFTVLPWMTFTFVLILTSVLWHLIRLIFDKTNQSIDHKKLIKKIKIKMNIGLKRINLDVQRTTFVLWIILSQLPAAAIEQDQMTGSICFGWSVNQTQKVQVWFVVQSLGLRCVSLRGRIK